MELVDSLIQRGWLKTPAIIEAFRKVKRVDFLPAEALAKEGLPELAELDEALSIGHGQTISQPLVVAFMLELLEPQPEERILDIGSGSGYTTALLAQIVNSKAQILNHKQNQNFKTQNTNGKVIGIEIVPELAELGKDNVAKYNFIEKGIAEIVCGDGSKGYKREAPYDRVLVSAALDAVSASLEASPGETESRLPEAWKRQLKKNGRLVVPIGNSIWLFVKKNETEFEMKEHPGFVFVPLV